MPRRQFRDDLKQAQEGPLPRGISKLCQGGDDGLVNFTYLPLSGNFSSVEITAMTDASDYPANHNFMIYTTSGDADESISTVLNILNEVLPRWSISELLVRVADAFDRASNTSSQPIQEDNVRISQQFEPPENNLEDLEAPEDYDETYLDDVVPNSLPRAWTKGTKLATLKEGFDHSSNQFIDLDATTEIRKDLLACKNAGFKVGFTGHPAKDSQFILSISCRVIKLGLSEETLDAWNLDRSKYFVLNIQFPGSYTSTKGFINLQHFPAHFAVCISSTYKPTHSQCAKIFAKWNMGSSVRDDSTIPHVDQVEGGQTPFFMERPISELLNAQFFSLFKIRMRSFVPWNEAEKLLETENNTRYGMQILNEADQNAEGSELPGAESLPLLNPKVLVTNSNISEGYLSFPLEAMQYTIRRLALCSEFCLVCHSRTGDTFKALKPYVCSKPLCLYQYLHLGLGPKMENEIISQPRVVEVLLSFCYTSAMASRLSELPIGLRLQVPHPLAMKAQITASSGLNNILIYSNPSRTLLPPRIQAPKSAPPPKSTPQPKSTPVDEQNLTRFLVQYDTLSNTVRFDASQSGSNPLKTGEWVFLTEFRCKGSVSDFPKCFSSRVTEASTYPTVYLDEAVAREFWKPKSPDSAVVFPSAIPRVGTVEAYLYKYSSNFDELSRSDQCLSICFLLSLLPSVAQMREFLLKCDSHTPSLTWWKTRVMPAGLGLLRWIIASNRASLFESLPDQRILPYSKAVQFRIGCSSPDKENKFVDAFKTLQSTRPSVYPTIFAWHGSALGNFHTILREGLHFKRIDNARAYGDGCYHSLDYNYSRQYSRDLILDKPADFEWPYNLTAVTSAICLNEIINDPGQFVTKDPIVVSHLDWIQTRFLLIEIHPLDPNHQSKPLLSQGETIVNLPSLQINIPQNLRLPQDPLFTPRDFNRQPIVIPTTAYKRITLSNISTAAANGFKRQKLSIGQSQAGSNDKSGEGIFDDNESVQTNESDNELMGITVSSTKWKPGTVDRKTLPILLSPSNSSVAASKTLQRELRKLIDVQEKENPIELGWYIDPSMINSQYQWIVELHSFEKSLPLVKDMNMMGIRSIVLEMRFEGTFPMSPPFVRVIRPRFTTFAQGGGGHVTAGGAMCMQLLTASGWSAASSIESVLVQVRTAIQSTDPFPARLVMGKMQDYSTTEAVDAFIRSAQTHGWEVPKDFRKLALDFKLATS